MMTSHWTKIGVEPARGSGAVERYHTVRYSGSRIVLLVSNRNAEQTDRTASILCTEEDRINVQYRVYGT